jgi:beta-mannanase
MTDGVKGGDGSLGRWGRPARLLGRRRLVAIGVAAMMVLLDLVLTGPAWAADSVPAAAVAAPLFGHAYLGASLNPARVSFPGVTAASADLLPSFDSGLGRRLSLVEVGLSWGLAASGPAPVHMGFEFDSEPYQMSEIGRIAADGAVPLISWKCSGVPDDLITSGQADSVITDFAAHLHQLGVPVLLEVFPNANDGSAATAACLGAGGPAGYVAAFRHVHDLFAAAGAANVSFLWTVSGGGSSANDFYPGGDVVDWIGDTPPESSGESSTTQLQPWYAGEVGKDKPLMAVDITADPAVQPGYIAGVSAALTAMPAIRAVVYADAPVSGRGKAKDPILTPEGLAAFQELSRLHRFLPLRRPTSVSLSESGAGEAIAGYLVAQVSPSDGAGTFTFFDHGIAVDGCTDLPLLATSRCDVIALSNGTHAVTVSFSGDAQLGPSQSAPIEVTVARPDSGLLPPATPVPGHVYLGAWVNPNVLPATESPIVGEMQALTTLEAQLGTQLSIVHVYQQWDNALSDPELFPALRKIVASGSIPMIDWACGSSDTSIADGTYDAQITVLAKRLAALKAPMFVRWYYEPNFPDSIDYQRCIGDAGPVGYQVAFRHIRDLFVAAGAANVSFVWTLAMSGPDPDPGLFYPGGSYVDWIAADGYFRGGLTVTATSFASRFSSWYSAYAGSTKPLMISETGTGQGFQGEYLDLLGRLLPSQYAAVRAVLYFDAPGAVDYSLDADGLAAMQSLAASPYFQPPRTPGSISAQLSPNPPYPGQAVRLSSNLSDWDLGGTVTYLVDGLVPSGCADLPVIDGAPSCAAALPAGPHVISASFSGDTQYTPATSAPVDVTTNTGDANRLPPSLPGVGSSVVAVQAVPPLQFVAPPTGALIEPLVDPAGTTGMNQSLLAASDSPTAAAVNGDRTSGGDWGLPPLLSGDHPLLNAVLVALMTVGLILGLYICLSWGRSRNRAATRAAPIDLRQTDDKDPKP